MKKIEKSELIIGVSVIAAILILIFGIEYLKGINLFSPANFYYASYDNVSELEISAPVSINGYKVGQVRSIEFDYQKPGKIKVLLALNKNLRIPADSKAMLGSTLMSGSYIDLHLGNDSRMLEIGSNIPTEESSNLMGAVTNDILPSVSQIMPKVDSLLINLNNLTSDPALIASIQRLDEITANLAKTSASLNNTIGRDVPPILKNINKITLGVDTVVGNLGELSNQLKTLPLNSTLENVESLTANLNEFSVRLKDPNSTLGMLTSDPELYNKLNRVAADIDSLILDIKKNPKRYISIKLL